MSVLFLLDNSASCLYAKCDKNGIITYRNELFRSSFSHIKPTHFNHLVSDLEDIEEVDSSFKWADLHNNQPKVFNCRTIQRNGVHRWVIWEVCNLSGEYHLIGQLLFDVVSSTAHQYEKLKKQLEDIKSIIAHEFRQPLRSIVGLNALLQQVDKDTDLMEYSNLLRMLNESTAQLDEVFKKAIDRGDMSINTY